MIILDQDIVHLKRHPQAVGQVEGTNSGGKVMVRWATTTSGANLKRPILLLEDPNDLEVVREDG